jgi:predicted DNA-binding transcriptional regulator AlpA
MARRRRARETATSDTPQSVKLLTCPEVAAALGVSTRTVERWRLAGQGPPARRLTARAVRYDAAALAAWVESRPVSGGEAEAGR